MVKIHEIEWDATKEEAERLPKAFHVPDDVAFGDDWVDAALDVASDRHGWLISSCDASLRNGKAVLSEIDWDVDDEEDEGPAPDLPDAVTLKLEDFGSALDDGDVFELLLKRTGFEAKSFKAESEADLVAGVEAAAETAKRAEKTVASVRALLAKANLLLDSMSDAESFLEEMARGVGNEKALSTLREGPKKDVARLGDAIAEIGKEIDALELARGRAESE